jgi:hypothetical protein
MRIQLTELLSLIVSHFMTRLGNIIVLAALLGLAGCATPSTDSRLVGTYVAGDSDALVFARDARVYHYRLSDGKERRVFLGYAFATSSSPPGYLSIAGPDASPFIGTSFQMSDYFSVLTVRWGRFIGQTYTPSETQFRRRANG